MRLLMTTLVLFLAALLLGSSPSHASPIVTTDGPVGLTGSGGYSYFRLEIYGYFWIYANGTSGNDSVWIDIISHGEEVDHEGMVFDRSRRVGHVDDRFYTLGTASINGVHSNYFSFSLGGGLGYLSLYDFIDPDYGFGNLIAHSQLYSWFAIDEEVRGYYPGTKELLWVDVTFDVVGSPRPEAQNPVPEPSTWLLLGFGLVCIVGTRNYVRRRREQ
jgi:hypothetical protein